MRWSVAPLIGAWLLVGCCIALILTMSGESFASPTTSRLVRPLLLWLYPDITWRQIHQVHFLVRKSAHLVEYALLGLFTFRAFRLTLDVSLTRHVLLALLLVVSVAGIDELRQSGVAARTGSLTDVAVDVTGGLVGVVLIVALHRRLGIGPPASRGET